jgi:hypothetical protein
MMKDFWKFEHTVSVFRIRIHNISTDPDPSINKQKN